jgi:hypothetical protein
VSEERRLLQLSSGSKSEQSFCSVFTWLIHFDLEDGGSNFHRNVAKLLSDYMEFTSELGLFPVRKRSRIRSFRSGLQGTGP